MRDLIRRLLDAVTRSGPAYQPDPGPARPSLALTGEPVHVWWGLDDVVLGDDGSVTVLLSGPTGEPYVLELEPSRAVALRDVLGPEAPAFAEYGVQLPDGTWEGNRTHAVRVCAVAALHAARHQGRDAVLMTRRVSAWQPANDEGGEG